jgi:hypothetical protein
VASWGAWGGPSLHVAPCPCSCGFRSLRLKARSHCRLACGRLALKPSLSALAGFVLPVQRAATVRPQAGEGCGLAADRGRWRNQSSKRGTHCCAWHEANISWRRMGKILFCRGHTTAPQSPYSPGSHRARPSTCTRTQRTFHDTHASPPTVAHATVHGRLGLMGRELYWISTETAVSIVPPTHGGLSVSWISSLAVPICEPRTGQEKLESLALNHM